MLKILVVEDSVILADMLEDFLISEGYDVCGLARTVHEAVALADLHKPDLAIFDFRLADGEYGSQIRPFLKGNARMGILYVSGDPLEGILTKADGDAYIQKPYGLRDLSRALAIIKDIKNNIVVPASDFPNGFRLLNPTSGGDRIAA